MQLWRVSSEERSRNSLEIGAQGARVRWCTTLNIYCHSNYSEDQRALIFFWWWCSVVSNSLWPHGLVACQALQSLWFSLKDILVGCHLLFQGIFPTQGLTSRLLCLWHWQADSLPLCHLGNSIFYWIYLLYE